MRGFIIRRILQIIPVFFGILLLLFILMELSPGQPLSDLQDPRITAAHRERMLARFNLDLPVRQRFFNWIADAVRGDFGESITHRRPVSELITTALPATLTLSISAMLVSMLIGIPLGILSAVYKGKGIDTVFTIFAFIGISMPIFFFGVLLILIFSVNLGLTPVMGYGSPPPFGRNETLMQIWADRAWHLILPVSALGLSGAASYMRYTRASMLEVIHSDYIRTARAKGLKESRIIFRHAMRNALIPIITIMGLQLPGLFSGSAITEAVFGLPGLGGLLLQAVGGRNYPIIIGMMTIIAIVTLASALIAEILYAVADPRIKYD
ncbi:MAG: ABC transporter permease [Defluviitaleaceae bacterium]|nr:ABC transporter permease [Defluviitaleaceae bacterium]MCL2836309.1 ABC transporter permease [Defluviitaleaceae bacterium]